MIDVKQVNRALSTETTDAPAQDNAQPASKPKEASEQKKEIGRWAFWPASLAVVVVGFIVDRLTKWWAVAVLKGENWPYELGNVIVVIPDWFLFRYAENRGAAWSILDGQVGFLAIISAVVAVFVACWWYRLPKEELIGRISLAMIFSGALGNFIDRVFLGYVIDMIDTYIFGYNYPVFNIADSLICIGIGILLVRSFQGKV